MKIQQLNCIKNLLLDFTMASFISQKKVSYECVNQIIYERKFDTAIRNTFAYSFRKRATGDTPTEMDLIIHKFYPECRVKTPSYKEDNSFIARIVLDLLTRPEQLKPSLFRRKTQVTIQEAVNQLVSIQYHYAGYQNHLPNKPRLNEQLKAYVTHTIPHESIRSLIELAQWVSDTMDKVCYLKKKRNPELSDEDYMAHLEKLMRHKREDIGLTITVSLDIMIVEYQNYKWIASAVCLPLLHNKLSDLISILLLTSYSSASYNPSNATTLTIDLISELCYLYMEYGMLYFSIAKALETFATAETLVEIEEWSNKEFLQASSKDLFEETGFCYESSNIRSIFRQCSPEFRNELGCLSKILGYPYVDMEGGARSLHEKTTEVYSINLSKVQKCINYIKENYIRNHILRYKRWPLCQIADVGCPRPLLHAYVMNMDPKKDYIRRKYGEVKIDDYDYIELLPNERFHKLDNIIPYLKDKTISLMRSKVLKLALDQETNTKSDKIPWEETRLLLAYLLNPKIVHDHKQFIDAYENSDDLTELLDYLVIRIVPKEKELKINFRGFGCATYENRARMLAQEKTAMSYLEKFSDEQAMTLGELELVRRLHAYRHLIKAYPGHKILYIVIDASSWNNHFRRETVDRVMSKTLDRIYDTTIFGKTHLAFNKTLFYVPNEPVSYSWDGQGGGIEGLNQDTWVITYIAQIKTALEDMDIKSHIFCKGDDLRVAVAVPPEVHKTRNMHGLKNEIVKRISDTMKDFGHKIKVMESYGSSRYFAFSKCASIDDIELPQGFRKIQKCYGASNAMIATLDEYIASTFSNAHSTCRVQPQVVGPYCVAVYWSLYYLLTSKAYDTMTVNELAGILLVPSLAGGFPIIYLHNMVVRAESDLLSPFLGLLSFCKVYYPEVYQVMSRFCVVPTERPKTFKMLYKDPYALPLDRPTLPGSMLRGYVKPLLHKATKNEDIRELLDAALSENDQQMVEVLDSCTELNVKVLSALYAATPSGLLEEFIRKFESARSINELLIRTIGYRRSLKMLRKIVGQEAKLQAWRSSRALDKQESDVKTYLHLLDPLCPAKSAYDVRTWAWGKPVTGITMPPLQHQLIYTVPTDSSYNDWVVNNHFTYNLKDSIRTISSKSTYHYSSAGCEPFLGYTTRTGTTEPTVSFIEKDPSLQKIQNLIDIVTWTNTEGHDEQGNLIRSNCKDVVELILGSFTLTPLDKLAPFSVLRRSGTVQHHVRSPSFRESIVPNTLSCMYTRAVGESDSHITLRHSHMHFTVNFLHIYCYTVWYLNLELEFGKTLSTPRTIWAVTNNCSYCNTPINEQPLIFKKITNLRRMRLHPLAVSRIGKNAERIIQESLDLCMDRVYNVEKDISLVPRNAAVLGILQEVHDNTYDAKIDLQNRYGVGPISKEGLGILTAIGPKTRGREIGQSEIKRMTVIELSTYLMHIILYYTTTKSSRFCLRDFSTLATVPGDQLPWFGVVDSIFKVGKLPDVITRIVKESKMVKPTCYGNPVSASRFLGTLAPYLMCATPIPEYIVVLSYYAEHHIADKIEKYWASAVRSNYITTCYKPIKSLTSSGVPIEHAYDRLNNLLYRHIVYSTLWHILPGIISYTVSKVFEHQIIELELIPINSVMSDDIMEWVKDDDREYYDPLQLQVEECLTRFGVYNIANLDQYSRDDWSIILYNMCATTTHMTTIVYTNLSVCVRHIRTMLPEEENSQDDEYEIIHDIHTDNIVEMIPERIDPSTIVFPSPSIKLTFSQYRAPLGNHVPLIINSTEVKYPLPLNECWRSLGSVNGSEFTGADILTRLESYLSKIPVTNILALADGYGGLTSVFMEKYPTTRVVFHTIPENTYKDVPVPAIDDFIDPRRIVRKHLEEGFYELNSDRFYNRIAEYHLAYSIILSDLELADSQLCDYKDILTRMIVFAVQYMIPHGVLIIKIRLDQSIINCCILDYCKEISSCVFLYQPKNVSKSNYGYLVVVGRIKYPDTFVPDRPPSDDTIVAWNQYVGMVRKLVGQIHQVSNSGSDLLRINHHLRSSMEQKFTSCVPRSLSLLSAHLFIHIPLDGYTHDNIHTWDKICHINDTILSQHSIKTIYGFDPSTEVQVLGNRLSQKELEGSTSFQRSTFKDTATSRENIISKMMIHHGLLYIWNSFDPRNHTWIIDTQSLFDYFLGVYMNLQNRDRRGTITTLKDVYPLWVYGNRNINYFRSFRQGVIIGLQMSSDWSILN